MDGLFHPVDIKIGVRAERVPLPDLQQNWEVRTYLPRLLLEMKITVVHQ